MKRKLFALIMAAVMCLGMSMTVFAATNESPDATTRPNDPGTSTRPEPTISEIYNSEILWKASIAAGGGTLVDITDEATQEIILNRIEPQEDRVANTIWKSGIKPDRMYYWGPRFAFDVQGVESGQVTIHLECDDEFDWLSEGQIVAVDHYNTATGEWEIMDKFPVVDANGNVTIEFDSYSPILLTVLQVRGDEVAGSDYFPLLKTNYTPVQTLTGAQGGTQAEDQSEKAAPKTGDNNMGFVYLLVVAGAVGGLVLTRRKMP